jgi:hypothetical protein
MAKHRCASAGSYQQAPGNYYLLHCHFTVTTLHCHYTSLPLIVLFVAQTSVINLITAMGQLYPEQVPEEVVFLYYCCYGFSPSQTMLLLVFSLVFVSLSLSLSLFTAGGSAGPGGGGVLPEGKVCDQTRAEQHVTPGCGCFPDLSA